MTTLPLFFEKAAAVVSQPPDDAYTDGLLETMRCQSGRVPLWPLHRARLLRCSRMGEGELAEIEQALKRIAADCPVPAAKLRLRLGYRGGRRCWDISLLPLEPTPELEEGARLFLCTGRLPGGKTANPGCKSLDRAGYNRAKAELPPGETCDGLLLDTGGWVIESLRCNLLLRLDGAWITPDLRRCGVRGVMRDWLGARIPLEEADIDLETLCAAEEVALCNSLRGVMPVRELIDHCRWLPGPETRQLQRWIAEELW
ncbi:MULTISPECIES: aminotransferase class IV [unclassified Microbulbifer]|uniref:aminotransferase class IV n=1 Tax=unclassified Microbulbifer TaxID=2619833 RepID=UPI0027E43D90|nr:MULTISPECIES: aminotransferase class IV [unclassified Microbulbifer]